jgi:CBS domain-containing protein
MKAREIMTPDPTCITPDDTIRHAAQIMREKDVGIIPVVESAGNRRLCGVVTDRDIAVRHVAEGHGDGCKVSEAMSKKTLVTASPDEDIDSVMRKMQERQVRRIPVVEGEKLVGIIAQADVATHIDEPSAVKRTVEGISGTSKR